MESTQLTSNYSLYHSLSDQSEQKCSIANQILDYVYQLATNWLTFKLNFSGQPLSLLLKQSPLVSQLSLYDIVHTPGVAADLSHIDTPAKVTGFNGKENLEKALENADVVIIPAGVPRKPGNINSFERSRMSNDVTLRLLKAPNTVQSQRFRINWSKWVAGNR